MLVHCEAPNRSIFLFDRPSNPREQDQRLFGFEVFVYSGSSCTSCSGDDRARETLRRCARQGLPVSRNTQRMSDDAHSDVAGVSLAGRSSRFRAMSGLHNLQNGTIEPRYSTAWSIC